MAGLFSIVPHGTLKTASRHFSFLVTCHSSLVTAVSVVADGFDGAGGEGFFAEVLFFFRCGLFADVGVAFIVGACEVVGRCITTHVAIYTGRVHVIRARDVLFYAIFRISQNSALFGLPFALRPVTRITEAS